MKKLFQLVLSGFVLAGIVIAKWDIDENAETTNTTDDPYPYVKITGGTVTVNTRGTDADGISVSEKTSLSPEEIEGKQAVFINGGKITVTTTDDGINASRDGSATVEINGGNAVFAFTIPGIFGRSASSNYVMILSSPKIITGTNYNVKSGVTVSVTEVHRKAHFQIQEDKI